MHLRNIACLLLLLVLPLASHSQSLTSNSIYAISFQNQRQLVITGAGESVLVYQRGSINPEKGLVLSRRPAGSSWSHPVVLRSDTSIHADVIEGAEEELFLTYSKNADSLSAAADIGFMRLTRDLVTGDWVIAHSSLVYDSSSETGAYNSVIAWDGFRLWVAFRLRDSVGYRIRVRYSEDRGVSWHDSVEADPPGTNADETAAFALSGDRLVLVYYRQNSEFKWRWRTAGDSPEFWHPAAQIAKASSLGSKSGYSLAEDGAGGLHLVYGSRGVRYLGYRSGIWDSVPVVLDAAGVHPKIGYSDGRAVAFWDSTIGSSQTLIKASWQDPVTLAWSLPLTLTHPSERTPDAAWCFSSTAATYSDVTVAAGNGTKGDVKHAATGVMLQNVDDAFYYGQSLTFDYLRVQLKTVGSGGLVAWEYWNGTSWATFNPVTSGYHFAKSQSVRLWPDLDAVPNDWAVTSVNGTESRFYVRARVTQAFSTAPLGTQVTSVKHNATPTVPAVNASPESLLWVGRSQSPYPLISPAP